AQIADMAYKLANLKYDNTPNDPQMEEPPLIKILHPSDSARDCYPPIKPPELTSFFTKISTDEEFWDQL
ncbi:hypothetical protein BGZ76_005848, partial [Entomortierella beljakovae]